MIRFGGFKLVLDVLFHPWNSEDDPCAEARALLTVKWISTSSVVFLGPDVSN